jgi:hypothetical protein
MTPSSQRAPVVLEGVVPPLLPRRGLAFGGDAPCVDCSRASDCVDVCVLGDADGGPGAGLEGAAPDDRLTGAGEMGPSFSAGLWIEVTSAVDVVTNS